MIRWKRQECWYPRKRESSSRREGEISRGTRMGDEARERMAIVSREIE